MCKLTWRYKLSDFRFLVCHAVFSGVLLLFCSSIIAQNPLIDSLKTELAKTKEDTTRILLICELARQLHTSNKDSTFHLLNSTIPLAERINFKAGLFELWYTKGFSHYFYKQHDSTFIDFDTARKIALEMGDKVRLVRALNGISYGLLDKRKAVPYLQEALEILTGTNDKYRTSAILTSLGSVYTALAVYDSSEMYYLQALVLQRELGDKITQANILRNLGNNAARANNLEKALGYYEQGILLMREMELKSEEAKIYTMLAYTYQVLGNFPKALEHYQVALKLMEEDGNIAGIASCCSSISELYISMEDYPQALLYIEKALKLWEGNEGVIQKPDLLYQKGNIYLLRNDYETALQYLKESLQLKKSISQTVAANHFYEIGHCFEQLGSPDSAIIFYQKALDVSGESSNAQLEKAKSLKGLGTIHFQQGKTAQAIAELNEAIEAAAVSGSKEQEMGAAEILYRIYKSQGNTDRALYYHEAYRNLQDSLFNEKNVKEIGRMEANYEFEKEKQQLAYEQEKESEKQRAMRVLFLIALGVAVLFIGVIYRYYRTKQKANTALTKLNEEILSQKAVVEQQKEKLEELDVAKSRFFTNISHEFRTPLTIISGMTDQIREKPNVWLERGTKMIKQNTVGLLNLVNQILDLRKLESNEMKVDMVQGDVVKYLRYIAESHQSYANGKGVKVHFLSASEEIIMDYDPDKMLRIISNLLSNAIKFTPEGGNIYFQVDEKIKDGENFLGIRMEDTGVGIPADKLPHVFNRFYQVDDSTTRQVEGTGIGLALTKELVKLFGGKIGVNSTVGKGTTFTLELPITSTAPFAAAHDVKKVFGNNDVEMAIAEPALMAPEINMPKTVNGRPDLLIVEDNPDVQEFLVACLEDHYNLNIANNGQEGIDKAVEAMPDLIVSDVLMPEKDGYELTESLKNDERTNHIPIVLLTAKADQDSKISGLEKGADAYLAKPFDKRELLVRLEKLLELRKKLQARYAHFSISENAPAQIEDPFLQKFYALVEKEISNPELDMNQLCRSLGMSRSQVFRKLKALTGKSATIFIRSIRLQQAKKLLATTDLTVSEVAYEVGFTSPSYFSTAFLEEFGIPPSATRK